jgi:hypothetical protein
MKASKDESVSAFLEELANRDSEKFALIKTLRELVFEAHPTVTERIMYGGIMFTLKQDFGGIFVYQNHVSFEFSNGVGFKDPYNYLEGSGKSRRHLKICILDEIKTKAAEYYINQVE